MVQVTSTPCDESEPILEAQNETQQRQEIDAKTARKIAYAEQAYKNIERCMKAEPLTIENPIVALQLFDTAVKVRNVPLAKQCISNLNGHINKKTVFLIMRHMSKYYKEPESDPNDFEPSAPPEVEEDIQTPEEWVLELIESLRHNCLLEIDKNADYVLKQKEIIELSYRDLLSITTRDTLMVSSEIIVYSAVMRWGMEECKRKTLQMELINIKGVLKALVYAARYGLMSKKEFLSRTIDGVKGPDRSGILDENETERILNYIKKRSKKSAVEELPYKLSLERTVGHETPKNLKAEGKVSRSSCDKFFINFLTCWTAVFD